MQNVVTKARAKAGSVKSAPGAKRQPSKVSEITKLVDAIIRANPAVAAAKGPKKAQDAAKKELLELLVGYDPKKPIVLKGTLGMVEFTACADGLEVTDPRAIHRMLGDDFYDIVSVGLKELKEQLTTKQLREVTEPCNGARRLSVLPSEATVVPGQDIVG